MLYGAGLRPGEGLRLRCCDVDLGERLLWIWDTKFFKSRVTPVGTDLCRALETYRKARTERGQPVEPAALYMAIESDRIFRIPATRLAEAQSAQQPSTYLYRFDWESPALNGALGACHAVELPFVFGTHGGRGGEMFSGHGPEADAMAARTMDAWLSFARHGSPSHDGLPAWPAYETGRSWPSTVTWRWRTRRWLGNGGCWRRWISSPPGGRRGSPRLSSSGRQRSTGWTTEA